MSEYTEHITIKKTYNKVELAEIATEMAEAFEEIEILEQKKKQIMNELKAEIEKAQTAQRMLAVAYKDGYTHEDYICTVVPDFDKKTLTYIDQATEEIVQTKKMPKGWTAPMTIDSEDDDFPD